MIAALSDRLAIVKENYMNLKNIVHGKDEQIEILNVEIAKRKEMVADLIEKVNDKPLPPTPSQLRKMEAAENEFQVIRFEDRILHNLEMQGLSESTRKPSSNSNELLAMHNIHANIVNHANVVNIIHNNVNNSSFVKRRPPPSKPPPFLPIIDNCHSIGNSCSKSPVSPPYSKHNYSGHDVAVLRDFKNGNVAGEIDFDGI